MFLHEERVRFGWMHRDPMDAVPDFRVRIGNVLRMQTVVDRFPTYSGVVGSERARGRDRDENALRIFWIDQDRVQTHPACARLPFRPGIVLTETGKFVPRRPAIF